MANFLHRFQLNNREDFDKISESVVSNIPFRGTNLWVLIFAIFIASIGLDVNSTAVIIGAMLISPLMGPIIGIGFGLAIYDLDLIKKAFKNFFFSVVISLSASTVYFLLSPISEAHSELLARTTPTIWDVLIALFGGFAGIVANASKEKGNVLPGVAIATALMPPLCTAGFGLAHLEWKFILGAFYLFIANSVFIALATFIVVQLLKFPLHEYPDEKMSKRVKRLVFGIVLVTTAPSIFIAVQIVRQNRFTQAANRFISGEANIPGNYLLNKKLDPDDKKIILIYGGTGIDTPTIALLKGRLKQYGLADARLEINEGFSLKDVSQQPEEKQKYLVTISAQQQDIQNLQKQLDSAKSSSAFLHGLMKEAKAEHPKLTGLSISPLHRLPSDSGARGDSITHVVYLRFSGRPDPTEQSRMEDWLCVKLKSNNIRTIIEP
jgi:uncharacterized hydrophobic protein (TIGR00271 family)